MEYIAKIIQEQRVENRLFWKYTFVDIQNNKEDYFLNNCQINYLPNFAGKLKLSEDDIQQIKIFQSFNQTDDTAKEFQCQATLIQQERGLEGSIKGIESDFAKRKKIKLTSQEIKQLQQKLSLKEIGDFCGVSE
jgi:hypothetical protein